MKENSIIPYANKLLKAAMEAFPFVMDKRAAQELYKAIVEYKKTATNIGVKYE